MLSETDLQYFIQAYMVEIPDEERCIAVKQSDRERCTRMAKNDQFCFQHDESYETVETSQEERLDNLIEIVSNNIQFDAASLSSTQKDVAQNINDILDDAGSLSSAMRSGSFSGIQDAFQRTAGKTGPTAGAGALVGGIVGSPFGPLGIATGATVGSWFGVYKSTQDDRAVAASIAGNIPEDVDIVSSHADPIRDVEPIQMAIKSAQDSQNETEWLRSTLTRERNMDEVRDALEHLPVYHGENDQRQHYIRDQDTGEVLLVIFGEPK